MFKKINRHLLLNHPQIWNTRVVWALLALLVIHLIFYLTGHLYFDDYKILHSVYGITPNLIASSNMGFSILVSALFIIIWLVFYFRNNPFKSYYPFPRTFFFIEFSIIFLVVISTITFYRSFASGFWYHVQHKTANVNLKEEANTLNLAYGLIPVEPKDYKLHACCDSLNYHDSLNTIMEKNRINNRYDAELDTAIDRFDRLEAAERSYNYFNFCKQYYSTTYDTFKLKEEIAATMQLWLSSGNKKEVAAVLKRFDGMCKLYKINNNVSINGYADKVFANKNFAIYKFIDNNEYDYENYRNKTGKPYLEFREVNQTLDNIYQSRHRTFDLEFWLFNLYFAIFAAIAIFTFRLTSVRVWLIAFVGAGVITIAVALLAAMLHKEVAIYIMMLVILSLFFIFSFADRKIFAGVNLVWFTWSLPFLGLVLYALLAELFRPITTYGPGGESIVQSNPTYDFLTAHHSGIMLVYLVVLFFYTATLLPLNYTRWMGMAEE